jgi:hypothetical protein
MRALRILYITKISIPGKLVGLISFVWGFLYGKIIIASYLKGFWQGAIQPLFRPDLVVLSS